MTDGIGGVLRLHHLGWVVRNIERAARQFEREGARVVTPAIGDPLQRVQVQFLADDLAGELWELIAPLDSVEDSPLASRLKRGGGLDHACYELDAEDGTLEAVLEAEQARGGRVICPPTFATAFGRRIAFVFRPSGRVVEFVERRGDGDVV